MGEDVWVVERGDRILLSSVYVGKAEAIHDDGSIHSVLCEKLDHCRKPARH